MCNQSVGLIASVIEKWHAHRMSVAPARSVREGPTSPDSLRTFPHRLSFGCARPTRTPAFDYSGGLGFAQPDGLPSPTALFRLKDVRNRRRSPDSIDAVSVWDVQVSNGPPAYTGHALCRLRDSLRTIRWCGLLLSTRSMALFIPSASGAALWANPRLSIWDCSFEGLLPSSELFLVLVFLHRPARP